jgi:hypothetical protein
MEEDIEKTIKGLCLGIRMSSNSATILDLANAVKALAESGAAYMHQENIRNAYKERTQGLADLVGTDKIKLK